MEGCFMFHWGGGGGGGCFSDGRLHFYMGVPHGCPTMGNSEICYLS